MIAQTAIHNLVPSVSIINRGTNPEFQINLHRLIPLFTLVKTHGLTRLNCLEEIVACDILTGFFRFHITYILLSFEFNTQLRVSIQTNELQPVISLTSIFNSAN